MARHREPIPISHEQTFRTIRGTKVLKPRMREVKQTFAYRFPKQRLRNIGGLSLSIVSRGEAVRILEASPYLRAMPRSNVLAGLLATGTDAKDRGVTLDVSGVDYVEEGDVSVLAIFPDDSEGVLERNRQAHLQKLRVLGHRPDFEWPYRVPHIAVAEMDPAYAVEPARALVEEAVGGRVHLSEILSVPRLDRA